MGRNRLAHQDGTMERADLTNESWCLLVGEFIAGSRSSDIVNDALPAGWKAVRRRPGAGKIALEGVRPLCQPGDETFDDAVVSRDQ